MIFRFPTTNTNPLFADLCYGTKQNNAQKNVNYNRGSGFSANGYRNNPNSFPGNTYALIGGTSILQALLAQTRPTITKGVILEKEIIIPG